MALVFSIGVSQSGQPTRLSLWQRCLRTHQILTDRWRTGIHARLKTWIVCLLSLEIFMAIYLNGIQQMCAACGRCFILRHHTTEISLLGISLLSTTLHACSTMPRRSIVFYVGTFEKTRPRKTCFLETSLIALRLPSLH